MKELLAPVFEKFRDKVIFAYLFGSKAKGISHPQSDVYETIDILGENRILKLNFAYEFAKLLDLGTFLPMIVRK